MALIEGPKRPCSWGHVDCDGHGIKPILTGLPAADPPKVGRCWCGEVGRLWQVPLDNRWYCRKCLRMALRVATYPDTIRLPDA